VRFSLIKSYIQSLRIPNKDVTNGNLDGFRPEADANQQAPAVDPSFDASLGHNPGQHEESSAASVPDVTSSGAGKANVSETGHGARSASEDEARTVREVLKGGKILGVGALIA
jgi:hypothetical protein